jgi:hypothetical protein
MTRLILLSFLLANVAAAEPSCPAQKQALAKWLEGAAVDRDRGAILSSFADVLVAIPTRKASGLGMQAMDLVIEAEGVREGNGRLVPFAEVGALVGANRNLEFARGNPNAIARGILIHAHANAPAASVRAAALVALSTKERVWLAFRLADKQIAAPPPSPLTPSLEKIRPGDFDAVLAIVVTEFGRCEPLMAMMRKMAGLTPAGRLDLLIKGTPQALEECKCKLPGPNLASILWTLAFRDLGTAVELTGKLDKLPWGKGTWAEAAPAIVKALP